MKTKILLMFLIFCGITIAQSNVQFDLRNNIILASYDEKSTALDDRLWLLEGNINMEQDFADHFSLYLDHVLDGSSKYLALNERMIPF